MSRLSLAALNAADPAEFADLLGGVFEHSPWVAVAACRSRPFASVGALHAAMVAAVDAAGEASQRALLRAHPELARPAVLTAASAGEQAAAGLDRLDEADMAAFEAANAAYRARFGFPFIIAVRGQRDRAAILAAMRARLGADPVAERATALGEVARIARFRLADLIDE